MKRLFIVAALASIVAVPALAADEMMAEDMTCADLMAMDEAGQKDAMAKLEMAAGKAEGKTMSSDEAMMSGEKMMPGTMDACKGNPDMKAMEAMHKGM